jgi:SAM-dependent methyltransferase
MHLLRCTTKPCKEQQVNAMKNWFKTLGGTRNATTLSIPSTFPLFRPYSAGAYEDRANLTIQAINQVFPFLSSLVKSVNGEVLEVIDISTFPKTDREKSSVEKLKTHLEFHGSDKTNRHNYHHLYGSILSDHQNIKNVFEIGLGTNNTDVVSNMGPNGKPGASLRAFKDHCPQARIFGADIDKRILFKEERIETFFVDQTDPSTFHSLASKIPKDFDLVIDDGLHSPNANVASLQFGLGIVKQGGWVVVEDIRHDSLPVWQVVAALLPPKYKAYIFNASGALVFAVNRLT